jgi:fatty acid desaturase
MPPRTFALILVSVIAAGGLTAAAIAWLPLPATWAIVGLMVAALAVRLSRMD